MTGARAIGALLCLFTASIAGCDRFTSEERTLEYGAGDYAEPERGTAVAGSEAAPPAVSLGDPPGLAAMTAEPVEGWTGPDGEPFEVALRTPGEAGYDRQIGRRTFHIALRYGELLSYPCGSCHQPGQPVIQPDREEDVHQNVQPVHPSESGQRCQTCHATDDVERLPLESGERATLDHAYRLCNQCHFQQAESWAQGAHGKRLDGWSGRRVVMGCTACHDPHRPAVQQRLPFPGPTIPRTGRRDP